MFVIQEISKYMEFLSRCFENCVKAKKEIEQQNIRNI